MRALVALILPLILLAACQEEIVEPEPGKLRWQVALLTPDPQPEAAVGVPYDIDMFFNIVDLGPYDWYISAGSLPPGLTLEPSSTQYSRMHGTPTASGHFNFIISIDCDVGTVDFVRGMDVLPAGALFITTTKLPFGTAGVPFGANIQAVGGSGVGYTWTISAGTLPAGIDIDPRDDTLNWGGFAQAGSVSQALGGGQLSQVSGMVASHSQPGVFWVHDQGAAFYAIDATGNVLQEYALNTTATDWEDVAIGPGSGGDVLYFGDFGDPAATRANCSICRLIEPVVPQTPAGAITLAHDEFWFEYPSGAQDCGTLLVDWANNTLFTVETVDTPNPRIHRFPTPLDTAWTSTNPVTLTQMTAAGTFDETLTAGDSSRDGRRIILRSFSYAREYALPAGQGFNMIFSETGSALSISGAQQHEAVCYSGDGSRLYTTTELAGQASAPIHTSAAAADNGYTTLSGTPPSPGTTTFTVRVTDSAGNIASRVLTLSIS